MASQDNSWNYITGNNSESTLVDIRAFPTDLQMKAIRKDMDTNQLTRAAITERYSAIIGELYAKKKEVNALIDHYEISGQAHVYLYNANMAIRKAYSYALTGPLDEVYTGFDRVGKYDRLVPRGRIIASLSSFIPYSTRIKDVVANKQKNGTMRLCDYDKGWINMYSSAIIERYKNGGFKAKYTTDIHRLYLNILRFEERLATVVSALEVCDKLNGDDELPAF